MRIGVEDEVEGNEGEIGVGDAALGEGLAAFLTELVARFTDLRSDLLLLFTRPEWARGGNELLLEVELGKEGVEEREVGKEGAVGRESVVGSVSSLAGVEEIV
jgi:hypothetical protein